MSTILIVSGDPSPSSRTGTLVSHVGARLRGPGHDVGVLHVRRLPTISLLTEDRRDPEISDALRRVVTADGVVVASPVHRAAHSGLVKALLDLLPERALRGRAVLPLAHGGSQGFLVALDHVLIPLLAGRGADTVVRGEFVLDRDVRLTPDGGVLAPDSALALDAAADRFLSALKTTRARRHPLASRVERSGTAS
ncbi:NAD(P)H-dependent oxidoreductase [Umezawaea beigongshangensis]|uniref:NAD(P)H-dependent oxidoreductase n=1 Tax=Umezawaea beigongshangensis TaxID=2780383 RepID=UPI0018F1ECCC|nr:NAD(P)H-dependent oxidoreductase [Umezawaea beigongshangensis]